MLLSKEDPGLLFFAYKSGQNQVSAYRYTTAAGMAIKALSKRSSIPP